MVKKTGKMLLLERWHPHLDQKSGYTGAGGSAPFPHNIRKSVTNTLKWKLGIPREKIEKEVDIKNISAHHDLGNTLVSIPQEMANNLIQKKYGVHRQFYNPDTILQCSLEELRTGKIKLNEHAATQFSMLFNYWGDKIKQYLQEKLDIDNSSVKIISVNRETKQPAPNFGKVKIHVSSEKEPELIKWLNEQIIPYKVEQTQYTFTKGLKYFVVDATTNLLQACSVLQTFLDHGLNSDKKIFSNK